MERFETAITPLRSNSGQVCLHYRKQIPRRDSRPPSHLDEGIVLDSRIQDDDEIVDVVFESVGIKRLAASLANLTIIS